MVKFLKLLIGISLLLFTVACGQEEVKDIDWNEFYFGTLFDSIHGTVEAEGRQGMLLEINTPMSVSHEPILYISEKGEIWSDGNIKGTVHDYERAEFCCKDQWEAEGYDIAPNDIEYTYKYSWLTVSSSKKPGSDKGVIFVSCDPNPYNTYRWITFSFGSDSKGRVYIVQKPNEDGVAPPVGSVGIMDKEDFDPTVYRFF